MNWYLKVMKQYADFSGRARRKEYWMFTLFNIIIIFALALVMGAGIASDSGGLSTIGMILYYGYALAIIIPSLAVCVRRLHDIGKSGWWYFIGFVPLVGAILLLVWFCTDSQEGKNAWGANPKEDNYDNYDSTELINTTSLPIEKNQKLNDIIEPFTRSESGFYDEKLERAKKEALKMILAEGSKGEKFLLDFLMRDVTVSGDYFNLKYYGDYANSEWYKKQKIVLALSCTIDKTIINKLSEILMLKGKENQFWTVFQPAVAETLGNLKAYSSLERYINSGQNVPAVLLSKDILRLYKAGVSEKPENKRDENGRMLLHNAVTNGDAELVQKLLADGADIDAVCSRGEELGETALYIAVVRKNLEIVKLLVKHKANLSAAAWNGTFPLQRAAAMGLFDVAKLLIDNGADKQQKTLTGKTALMWAEQNGYSNIAALLK